MRKTIVYIILCLFVFTSVEVLAPTELSAKGKSAKVKHRKKTKRTRKSADVDKSLSLLKTHFPEYSNMDYLSEMSFLQDIAYLDEDYNRSIFADYELRYHLVNNINKWLGTPYRRGGRTGKGVDCSNFVSVVIEETLGFRFPAGASSQSTYFSPIKNMDELQFGDLLFFSGSKSKRARGIRHVGIYINDGMFAHSSSASSGRGVKYSLLTDGYYTERFRYGGRFTQSNWAVNLNKSKINPKTETTSSLAGEE
ncbi:MAG: C40 family peptidase [Ignavibacteriae bacterium]|nr:C40 family peptidase [Ignavibacteriota bacterium]